MAYDFDTFDTRADGIVDWLIREFASIRTGRATTALLDAVKVESYGALVPLNQVGNIGIEDPRTLLISLWDKGLLTAVERAITDANLGVSVSAGDTGIRVSFPDLTSERREQLLKIARQKLEEARISVRGARDEALKKLEAEELPEDDEFRAKDELQKKVEKYNNSLEALYTAKEKEIHA